MSTCRLQSGPTGFNHRRYISCGLGRITIDWQILYPQILVYRRFVDYGNKLENPSNSKNWFPRQTAIVVTEIQIGIRVSNKFSFDLWLYFELVSQICWWYMHHGKKRLWYKGCSGMVIHTITQRQPLRRMRGLGTKMGMVDLWLWW